MNERTANGRAGSRPRPGHIHWSSFAAPIGRVYAAVSPGGLCRLTWRVRDGDSFEEEIAHLFPGYRVSRDPTRLATVRDQIRQYFEGRRRRFAVALDLGGLTDFERGVLEHTRRIPFGSTSSYGELARRLRRPRAARAVGNALRANPIPIIVPCHRVLRSDGSLGGYGGTTRSGEKRRLLELEESIAG